jgi:hypothetical protein
MTATETTAEITRRLHHGVVSETVRSWHYRSQGPGEPGGRTYDALYAADGRVRVDVMGCWGSVFHTVWLRPDEIRPRGEWLAWLAETGQPVPERRWCTVDGMEIPADSDPEFDENCCSVECRIETRPDF